MVKYCCKLCNYSTNRLSNWSRHTISKKHKNNDLKMLLSNKQSITCHPSVIPLSSFLDVTESDKDNKTRYMGIKGQENKSFVCEYCGSEFSYRQGLHKHIKMNCKIKKTDGDEILELKEQNKKLLDLATSNAKVANKSMGVMSYALEHFKDAPKIELLEDDQFNKISKLLMYDEMGKKKTKKSIEEVLLFHHKQNTLSKILGDLIVKVYKKSNPKKQSAWSSDVARLTFIVKDVIGNSKRSKWVIDKKGIHFTETIIGPLMNKIKNLLIKYNEKCGEKVRNISKQLIMNYEEENKVRTLLALMQETNLALLTINLEKIHTEILKYVAPHFNLDINKMDDDKEISDFSNSSDSS